MEELIPIIFIVAVVIVIAVLIGGAIFFRHLRNVSHRATQSILNNNVVKATNKNIPLSDSAIHHKMNNSLSKKATQKFITEHSSYSEETIREYFKVVVQNLINGTEMDCFNSSVKSKLGKDSKIAKMGQVEVKTAYLMSYAMNRYAVTVIVANKRDEYIINIYGTTNSTGFDKVDKYSIQKGVAVGL